jgi:hypothetical protein
MKHIAIIIALFIATLAPSFGHGHSSGHFSRTGQSTRVRTYTRKNGTVVHQHRRAAPHTAPARRSREARAEFMRQQPCAATGRTSGACPGYVADHIIPLACGGADAPLNMQWQTVAEGKAKDKWERVGCSK